MKSPKKTPKSAAKNRNRKPATNVAKKSAKKPVKKAVKKAAKKIAKKAVKTAAKAVKAVTKIAKSVKTVAKKITKTVAKKSAKKATKKAAAKTGPSKKIVAKIVTTKSPASRRPKTFAGAESGKEYGFAPGAPEIPVLYGEDRLVLMTKDPEYLFAYWEVTPGRLAEGEKLKRRGQEYREAMRLNWEARDLFERNYALLPVSLASRKWYLRVPFSGLAYHVELGWLGDQGHFVSLLASNRSDAPESWAATRKRLKAAAAGEVLAYNLSVGKPSGSSELAPPEKSPAPLGWDFGGPGELTSSFATTKKDGKPTRADKRRSRG